ncbi:hypothetical protein [Dysosmobacter sp.]|uniref:hypothetical protein n=1 Tax=Dysosmobacter sp. TaxID=2591382 RepID=UPI002A8FEDFF|nr:hypothetical protein [Dysosmobacter sp.]MDY3281817.1 hypothetical protein [Dysosmobacter sp.]
MGLVGVVLGLARIVMMLVLLAVRVVLPVAVGVFLYRLARREKARQAGEKRQEKRREPDFQGTVRTVDYRATEEAPHMGPEPPVPFGYKSGWAAIRCGDPRQVTVALGLRNVREASWSVGLEQAEQTGRVFVSPCLEGFVLVVGLLEVLEGADLPRWTAAFSEVQFFATHRVTEFHRWGRCRSGRLLRDYCYCGERGEVLRDVGEPTPEETALGFGGFPAVGGETECQRFPNEEDVLDIAAAWGVDPRFARGDYPPSMGWVCEL